jgi:hypothetical protein
VGVGKYHRVVVCHEREEHFPVDKSFFEEAIIVTAALDEAVGWCF